MCEEEKIVVKKVSKSIKIETELTSEFSKLKVIKIS